MMRQSLLAFLLITVACGDLSSPTDPVRARCTNPAPLFRYPDVVPDRYIVVYRDGVDVVRATAIIEAKYGIRITHIFTAVLGGFAATVPPATLQSLLCESVVKEIHEVTRALPPPSDSTTMVSRVEADLRSQQN